MTSQSQSPNFFSPTFMEVPLQEGASCALQEGASCALLHFAGFPGRHWANSLVAQLKHQYRRRYAGQAVSTRTQKESRV